MKRLEEIRERYKDQLCPEVDLLDSDLQYLLDRCERYEKALEFYANRKWEHGYDDCTCHYDDGMNTVDDVAKEALKEEPESQAAKEVKRAFGLEDE